MTKQFSYYLKPQYDGVKSFYSKAWVEYHPVYKPVIGDDGRAVYRYYGDKLILKSYGRDVCEIDPATNEYVLYGLKNNYEESPFTHTTIRHIREFLKQADIPAGAWKSIYNNATGVYSCGKWIKGNDLTVELKTA